VSITRDYELAIAIDARNAVNAYANDGKRQLLEFFRPLVGKQIIKNDKSLLDRVKKQMPKLPWTMDRHCHHQTSEYMLYFEFFVRVDRNGQSYSETQGIRVGQIANQILVSVNEDDEPFVTDYNVDVIRELRRLAREAEKVASEAKGKCCPFEE
jgi:hypothetical protein